MEISLWNSLTAMTPSSVAIDRLVLWHIPRVHDYRLAINSASSSISLALALVSTAACAAAGVLKSAAGVTVIGDGGVCHLLVIITGFEGVSSTCSTRTENRRPAMQWSIYVQGWQPWAMWRRGLKVSIILPRPPV